MNLVRDGSFEIPAIPDLPYFQASAGDSIGAWAVVGGPVDLISGGFWKSAAGYQSLDLDGSCGVGAIVQRIPTTPGHVYTLCFALAGNPDGSPSVKSMTVQWGTAVVDSLRFDVSGSDRVRMGWSYYQYSVTATADSTDLLFRSMTPGCYGPVLDDVSVQEESPPTI